MALAIWPPGLPIDPLVDGYDEPFPDLTLETQMDAGPPKSRRKSTAAFVPVTLSFDMTRDQVDLLEEFYLETCGGGVLPFQFSHPRKRTAIKARFRKPPPHPKPTSAGDWIVVVNFFFLP